MSVEDCDLPFADRLRPLAADCPFIDFAPPRLRDDLSLRDAAQALVSCGLWGMPVVDDGGHYVGICTLRSLAACVLPAGDDAPPAAPAARGMAPFGLGRLNGMLERPIREVLDLQVPAVRVSTAMPQLLAALCRRAPVIPIVSDSGMRLLGIASLERAVRTLYGTG